MPLPGYPITPLFPGGDFYVDKLPHEGPHPVKPATVETIPGGANLNPVTKTDILINDVDDDDKPDPGDTIQYWINIFNSGDATATNVVLQDLLDPDTELVPGSVNVSPLAFDDFFPTLGNIQLDSAALGMPGLLDNDREYFEHTIGVDTLVTDFDATSTAGGAVNVNPDGTFTYDPPVGFSGPDTFTYTLTDSGGLSDIGFVDIDVVQPVWFIDSVNGSDAPLVGTGSRTSPFQTPAPVNAMTNPGDWIFVLDDGGAGTDGGFLLKDNQTLLGQGVPLELDGVTFVPATNRPTVGSPISNAINLASDNTIRGLNVNAMGLGAGIGGLNVGALNINEVDLTVEQGSGVDFRNGSGVDITFDGLMVSNISNPGLSAVRFENLGGTISVTGDTIITDIEGLGYAALGNDQLDITHTGQLVVSNIGSSGLDGVSIDLDPNSTVDFNGGVDITTTNGGGGLTVTSSGTVNILGTSSSINSSGTGLSFTDTLIGPGGLTFDTIVAGNGVGSTLSNTGTQGGLTILNGGPLNDFYGGSDGNDFLHGGPGSDTLIGEPGFDTALFTGNQADYGINDLGGGQWEVTHTATGDLDTLFSIERLQFDDGVVLPPGPGPAAPGASAPGPAAPADLSIDASGTAGPTQNTGALIIGAGDVIAPGNSPGTTPAGDTVFDGLGTFQLEVSDFGGTAGTDPGWDLLDITGTLTVNATTLLGAFNLQLDSLLPLLDTPGDADNFADNGFFSIDFVHTTGGITGFTPGAFVIDTSGFTNTFTGTFSVRQAGNDLFLDYTPADAVQVFLDDLPKGKKSTVTFDAIVKPGATTFRFNQGTVTADGSIIKPSDDSSTTNPDDPTRTEVDPGIDFGDAPDPLVATAGEYPTLLASNGASHVALGPQLGPLRDVETDGQPSADAGAAALDGDDGDGSDDDDGITFLTPTLVLDQGVITYGSVEVDLQHPDPVSNRLDAFIDFNADGDWVDADEQVLTDFDLGTAAGVQTVTFPMPRANGANVVPGPTFARFRISTAGGLLSTGPALDGEVEDYLVTVTKAIDADSVVDLPNSGGDLVLELQGTDVVLTTRPGGVELFRAPQNALNSLTIEGGDGDDTLTVDLSGGPIAVPINFNGGGNVSTMPGDQLLVTGPDGSDLILNYDNNSEGDIDIDGTTLINYTGLEPIAFLLTPANVTLNYSGAMETITATDAGGGMTNVNSDVGGETTTFPDPTVSLTIDTGGSADTVNVDGLTLATSSLTITDPDGNDTVDFQITASSIGGALDITAPIITQSVPVTVTGTTTLDAGVGGAIGLIDPGNDFIGALTITNADTADIEDANDLAIDSVTTTTSFFATANAGAITDASAGEGANITTVSTALRAATGIGDASVDDDDIDTAVTDLAATTVGGDISVSDDGSLDIDTVDSLAGVSITTGGAGDDILIRNALSVFDILSDVNNLGAGDIALAQLTDTDLEVEANVTASGGNVLIISREDIEHLNTPTISTTGTGTIQALAGRIFNFGAPPTLGAADGDIFHQGTEYSYTSAGGNITLTATDDLQLDRLDAGGGTVIVTADSDDNGFGAITDTLDTESANVTAAAAVFRAADGIASGDDINTAVSALAASNSTSGDIHISNDVGGLLTIGTVDGLVGVTNAAPDPGVVLITNASPVTVANEVTANGPIGISALDGDVAGGVDNLTVDAGVAVTSNANHVNLFAGDDLHLAATSTVSAPNGSVFIKVDDFFDPDAGPNTTGSTVTLGDNAVLTSLLGTQISGGDDPDVFNLIPQLFTDILLDGDDPRTPLPADTLNLNLIGLPFTGILDLVPTTLGYAANFSTAGVGAVNFINIETFNPLDGLVDIGVRFDLSNDPFLTGLLGLPPGSGIGDDGLADQLTVDVVPEGMRLTVSDDTGVFYDVTVDKNRVSSLDLFGSSDDDSMIVLETANGLPCFAGQASNAHTNAAFDASGIGPGAGNIGMAFIGGGGDDDFQANFLTPQSVAYFADEPTTSIPAGAAPNSGVISVGGQFTLSFEGLAPMAIFGAGGSLLLDGSAAPAITFLSIDDDVNAPGPLAVPPGVASDGVTAVWGDGGWETVQYTGFADVTVRSGLGTESIVLRGIDYDGVQTDIILDGDNNINSDSSNDLLQVQSLPAAVTATLFGGSDVGAPLGDTFSLFNLGGSIDAIQGLVDVSPPVTPSPAFPVTEEPGFDRLIVADPLDTNGDTVTVTDTTIDGITGAAGIDVTYHTPAPPLPGGADQIEEVHIITSDGFVDTIDVQSTFLNSVYRIITGTLGPGSDDVVNISSDAPVNAGNLNGIQGQVNINFSGGANTALNVSDAGDNAGDIYDLIYNPFSGNTELYFNDGTASVGDTGFLNAGTAIPDITFFTSFNPVANFTLTGDSGSNAYNIYDTTATTTNTVNDGAGNSLFNIQADAVQPGSAHVFNGFVGNDSFNLQFASDAAIPGAAGTSFQINGGDPGADTDNRDVVDFNVGNTITSPGAGLLPILNSTPDLAARNIGMTYGDTPGSVDVSGLGTDPGAPNNGILDLNTVETVFYNGTGPDDAMQINGTAGDDDLTVAPLSLDEALVFLGGNPWDGPPPADTEGFFSAIPGIGEGDGSTGPDMRLAGLAALNVDGMGGTNQLYVYGESEMPITAGTTDALGLGAGVIIPGQGAGNAYDEILVSDSLVRFVNDAQAAIPADVLLPVGITTPSFVQPTALTFGLTVNAGFEASPPPVVNPGFPLQVADDIIAAISANFSMQVNGGNPVPAFAPDGDRLNVVTLAEVNVFSDKSTPPVVSVTSGGSPFSVGFSSIEFAQFTPGNGQVNLIGDNNDPAIDQNDNFIVLGQDIDGDGSGANEFSLRINGDTAAPNFPALYFDQVTDLNVFGDDQNPPPGVPSAAPDIDTLEITPWADDTPEGWGIDVFFDEGNPPGADGDQTDLIILHTALLGGEVSEDISIIPSGPDNGEIVVTNGSFGTPIVDIDYVANTDIIVLDDDGFANDTDTLTLFGTDPTTPQTSGNEMITADFAAAGDLANPIITVNDGGTILYRVRTVVGIDSLTFETLGGDDTLTVLGQNNGATVNNDQFNFNAGSGDDVLVVDNSNGLLVQSSGINYDGGIGRDQLVLNGSTVVDASLYFVGPNHGDGQVVHFLGGTASQTVTFTGLEPVIDVVTAENAAIVATDAGNAINYTESNMLGTLGMVSVDGFETLPLCQQDQFGHQRPSWQRRDQSEPPRCFRATNRVDDDHR